MADFGWSAGCVVEAIKICNKVRKALKDAGGASDQYQEAVAFFDSFSTTLEHLRKHIEKAEDQDHVDAIQKQLDTINVPWNEFSVNYEEKYEKSLAKDSTRSKGEQMPRKVLWALKEVEGEIRKLKTAISQPLSAINCLLLLKTLDTISEGTSTPFSEAQCKQFVDTLGESPIPHALAQQIATLRAIGEQSNTTQMQMLERLEELQRALTQCEAKFTSMSKPISEESSRQTGTSEDEFRAALDLLRNMQPGLTSLEAKDMFDRQQRQLVGIEITLGNRIQALEEHVRASGRGLLSVYRTVAVASGAVASFSAGFISAVYLNLTITDTTPTSPIPNGRSGRNPRAITYNNSRIQPRRPKYYEDMSNSSATGVVGSAPLWSSENAIFKASVRSTAEQFLPGSEVYSYGQISPPSIEEITCDAFVSSNSSPYSPYFGIDQEERDYVEEAPTLKGALKDSVNSSLQRERIHPYPLAIFRYGARLKSLETLNNNISECPNQIQYRPDHVNPYYDGSGNESFSNQYLQRLRYSHKEQRSKRNSRGRSTPSRDFDTLASRSETKSTSWGYFCCHCGGGPQSSSLHLSCINCSHGNCDICIPC